MFRRFYKGYDEIHVDERMNKKPYMLVVIHELLHIYFPNLSEKEVDKISKKICNDLWKLKFSESIFLRTQKERIIPYVIVMFFYWWMYYLSRNFTDQPLALKYFYFGIFIASALGLTANHFIKVSLHAIGVSGLLTAVVLASFYYPINNVGWVLIGVLISGAVISARMMVSDHTHKELWLGFIIGLSTQLAAFFWVQ